ncbi:hypothetical protein DB347_23325 [Opitutaceae bacterium EW11]|nr:hypothetical protein DB347_23325 [Opitutaceae bacterium EW11]
MNPAQLVRTLQTALDHHNRGRLPEAERLYRQVLAASPKAFDPLHLLGVLQYQKGRYTEAVDLLSRAHAVDSRNAACEMRLGLALAALQRMPEAEKHLRGAVQKDPKSPDVWSNLGIVLRASGQFAEAANCFKQTLALKPDAHEIHDRLGALVADTEGLPAGIPHFKRAVEVAPGFAQGWCNLGLALLADRRYAEALAALDRALQLEPQLLQAKVGRGLAFQQTYQLDEAMETFGQALAQNPAYHEARSARLLTLNYLAGRSREDDYREHLAFGAVAEAAPAPELRPRRLEPGEKLKLAFLSADLRSHSVAYFLEPLLQHLDRSRFEICLYHDHHQVDAMSERLRAHADLWRNFVGQLNPSVEAAIRADKPDILVDLAGHTGLNRLPLLARRLAPVQITYLGYPNTTGLRAMDYRFVDTLTDPDAEDERFHTEKLVRFSRCAWSYLPPASAPEPARTGDTGVTFGSFNNLAKLSPEILAVWSRILAAVPGSRLLLKGHGLQDPAVRGVVEKKLLHASLDPARVELLGRTPNLASHLELYHRVDIALDAFPYHGTTTTCEALWMGVPVITLRGDRHASRVGVSLLSAAGRPEWIASSADDYVRLAAELANDSVGRNRVRAELRQQLAQSILMDHRGQARRFGEALLQCWAEQRR